MADRRKTQKKHALIVKAKVKSRKKSAIDIITSFILPSAGEDSDKTPVKLPKREGRPGKLPKTLKGLHALEGYPKGYGAGGSTIYGK